MNKYTDINKYIQNELSGQNNPNQKEKSQYLGVLSERIHVLITNQHVNDKTYQTKFNDMVKNNPGGQIKINAQVKMSTKLSFIKIANNNNTPFTVVDNDGNFNAPNQVAVVYHFNEMTHQDTLDISQLI